MAEPYLSEIRLFPWNWAPKGWALCQGQLLSIAQNTALFSLLGTTYGGDGRTTFGLPDFRGRVGIGPGQGPGLSSYVLGQRSGVETVTLTTNEMPAHTHLWVASTGDGSQNPPLNAYLGRVNRNENANVGYLNAFATPGGNAVALGNTLTTAGGSQAHSNMAPTLVLNPCIATSGIFPSRN